MRSVKRQRIERVCIDQPPDGAIRSPSRKRQSAVVLDAGISREGRRAGRSLLNSRGGRANRSSWLKPDLRGLRNEFVVGIIQAYGVMREEDRGRDASSAAAAARVETCRASNLSI